MVHCVLTFAPQMRLHSHLVERSVSRGGFEGGGRIPLECGCPMYPNAAAGVTAKSKLGIYHYRWLSSSEQGLWRYRHAPGNSL